MVATSKKEKPCCEVKVIGLGCCLLFDQFVAIAYARVGRMINSSPMGINTKCYFFEPLKLPFLNMFLALSLC